MSTVRGNDEDDVKFKTDDIEESFTLREGSAVLHVL
jgi:hypothetical protein